MSKEASRFIQFGCRLCGDMSPVCDQKEDIQRRGPALWYQEHLADKHSHPAPAIVRAEGTIGDGLSPTSLSGDAPQPATDAIGADT